jgi:hypothetical protein
LGKKAMDRLITSRTIKALLGVLDFRNVNHKAMARNLTTTNTTGFSADTLNYRPLPWVAYKDIFPLRKTNRTHFPFFFNERISGNAIGSSRFSPEN